MTVRTLTAPLIASLILSGCFAFDPYAGADREQVTSAQVRREYALPSVLAFDCVRTFGVLTSDHRACLVRKWSVCFYLTRRGDRTHDRELRARCNGWLGAI